MKLGLDPRLPYIDDIKQLKLRLLELFREYAIRINALSFQIGHGGLLSEYADDAAAETGGIEIGQFYRTGSAVKQRVA